MASFDFPASPNDNNTYSLNGVTYKYVAAKQRWEIVPTPHNFETTAQLDIRDTANRSRSNHTGTQTASTITDFDTEVSNNTDVAANTSARHDAVTVVDSSEIDFTLTGQEITASIVAGSIDESKLDASVNASLDLADGSVQLTGDQSIAGTKTFITALILPNNSRINGVEHFYQPGPIAPTVRGDGSALVAGDRWWKTDDGTEWFWNGTYWLSNAYYSTFKEYVGPNTKVYANYQFNLFQTAGTEIQFKTNYVLIEAIGLYLQNTNSSWFTGVLDGSNYFKTGVAGVSTNRVTINSVDFFNNRNSRPRQLISSPITLPSQQSSETIGALFLIDGVVGNPSLSWASGFNYYIVSKIRNIYF